MAANLDKVLIFMHIPKTAGSTLRGVIDRQYEKHEVAVSVESLKAGSDNIQCLRDRVPFGIHRYLSRPFTYITLLRDPVERVISNYYFILNAPDHHSYNQVKKISLKQFAKLQKYANKQTRFVSGEKSPDLKKAIENFNHYFSVVGLTERFDESLFLMKKEFGWNHIDYVKKKVNNHRPPKDQIPKDVIDLIRSNNMLDLQLYEYGKERFETKLQQLDSVSRQELHDFLKRGAGK